MRSELELLQKIEQYLNNELSAADKKAFEELAAGDPALREAIELQREIMKGMEHTALKKAAEEAGHRYRRSAKIRKWGLGGLAVIVVIAALLLYLRASHSNERNEATLLPSGYSSITDSVQLPELNEARQKQWSHADSILAPQVFELDASRDTVIETKAGIMLSVPANGLQYPDGDQVKGRFHLIVKEAMDAASVIKGGLSTTSGDRLLETAGMFFIDARQNGEILKIDAATGILAAVPADTVKPDMMLFKGKRTKDGGIDWTDPTQISRPLFPVDLSTLDFYPPRYVESVINFGYSSKKSFTDSLYYSFASYFEGGRLKKSIEPAPRRPLDTLHSDTSIGPAYAHCGINPASVNAIRSGKFQQTFIATREFEERMRWIHYTGDNNILDIYIRHLDSALSYCDSLAAKKLADDHNTLSTQFARFAAQRKGRLIGGNPQAQHLSDYFYQKTKAYTEAIAQTHQKMLAAQAALNEEARGRRNEHDERSFQQMQQNYEQELQLNMKEAYRQLGYDTTIPKTINGATYLVQVTTTGWNNIDLFVEESVRTQTTLDYKDQSSGKRAVISYQPISLRIKHAASFERTAVYLLPDKLNSFIRLYDSSGIYAGKLNELMQYSLVIIGYKGDAAFCYSAKPVKPGMYDKILLNPVSAKELDQLLRSTGSPTQAKQLKQEDLYFLFESQSTQLQLKDEEMQRLREHLFSIVFPCAKGSVITGVIDGIK